VVQQRPAIEPWLPVPEERYYLYQTFWTIPWGMVTALMLAGVIHVSAVLGRLGPIGAAYDDALSVLAPVWQLALSVLGVRKLHLAGWVRSALTAIVFVAVSFAAFLPVMRRWSRPAMRPGGPDRQGMEVLKGRRSSRHSSCTTWRPTSAAPGTPPGGLVHMLAR